MIREASVSLFSYGEFMPENIPTVYGVGHLGNRKYKSTHEAYCHWLQVMRRCYDPKTHIKSPSYKECTVHEEWHNFQNFALWFIENYPKTPGNFHLDKDHLVKGNKVYGPHTCKYITADLNVRIQSHMKISYLTSPFGQVFQVSNQHDFALLHGVRRDRLNGLINHKTNSHRGWKRHE